MKIFRKRFEIVIRCKTIINQLFMVDIIELEMVEAIHEEDDLVEN
jgi:hypothetical protein